MPQVYGTDPHSFYSKVPISNYAEDATGGGLWTSTTTYRVTVPPGKIYWLWGGYYKGNTADTVVILLADASDNPIVGPLLSEANGSTGHHYPDPALINIKWPIPLLAGWYIEATAGAAQDATAFSSCIVTATDAIA